MAFDFLHEHIFGVRILQWDHNAHPGMVWRFPDPSSKNEMERDPNRIDAFQVKIGERAISLMNNQFYEDTPPGLYRVKREQRRGLEVIYVDQGQVKQPWGIPGTILTKDEQNLGAHGSYMFRITDTKSFVLSIVSAQRAYTSEQVNEFIRDYIGDVLRQHLTNYTVLDGQILREREEFVRAMKAKCQEMFGRWGLELVNMDVEIHIPEELERTLRRKGEFGRYRLTKSIDEQILEIDNRFDVLRISAEKVRDLEEYKAKIEIESVKRQYDVLVKESEQVLKTMDIEITKLEGEMAKIATEIQAGHLERIAPAEALATELRQKSQIAGELHKKTIESELKIKEMEAESKAKTGLAEVDAWKEVEKARAEAQRRIWEEENKLNCLKEMGKVLADMAEAVAVGGAEGEATRKGLEEKFVKLVHDAGIDVPEYERAKRWGQWPPIGIKIDKTVTKEEGKSKSCACGRKLAKDAKFCDGCGAQQPN